MRVPSDVPAAVVEEDARPQARGRGHRGSLRKLYRKSSAKTSSPVWNRGTIKSCCCFFFEKPPLSKIKLFTTHLMHVGTSPTIPALQNLAR